MFLRLHDANDKLLRINMNLIETYGTITVERYDMDDEEADSYLGLTYVVPHGITKTEPCYVVKETPEQIDKMMEDSNKRNIFVGGSTK